MSKQEGKNMENNDDSIDENINGEKSKKENNEKMNINSSLLSLLTDNSKVGWTNFFYSVVKSLILILVVALLIKFAWWFLLGQSVDRIEKVQAFGNTISFKSANKEYHYYLFSSSELWANPGLKFNSGDKITITATGKYNSAIHHLVDYSKSDNNRVYPWIGPEGIPFEKLPRNSDKHRYKLGAINNQVNYGALLARRGVTSQKNDGKIYYFDNGEIRINFEEPGYIELAVNEPILTKDNKSIYLITEDIDSTYESKRSIKKQNETWEEIKNSNYLSNLWFDDNVGQLFILITKEK